MATADLSQIFIESYRYQYERINKTKSTAQPVKYGVPQGSVLGQLLSILYINDTCSMSGIFNYVLFADDMNVFCSTPSINNIVQIINTGNLRYWFHVCKYSLNVRNNSFISFNKKLKRMNQFQ